MIKKEEKNFLTCVGLSDVEKINQLRCQKIMMVDMM